MSVHEAGSTPPPLAGMPGPDDGDALAGVRAAAERALRRLRADYRAWLGAEAAALVKLLAAADTPAAASDVLARAGALALEAAGDGEQANDSVLVRITASMGRVADGSRGPAPRVLALLRAHLEAVRFLATRDPAGDRSDGDRQLAAELEAAAARLAREAA